MSEELDRAVLTTDLPEHGLRAGDLGTVVMDHEGGKGYTVEFVSLGGDTMAMVTLAASDLRPVRPNEIANACARWRSRDSASVPCTVIHIRL